MPSAFTSIDPLVVVEVEVGVTFVVENSVFSCGVRLVPVPVEFVFPVKVMVTPEAVKNEALTSTKL